MQLRPTLQVVNGRFELKPLKETHIDRVQWRHERLPAIPRRVATEANAVAWPKVMDRLAIMLLVADAAVQSGLTVLMRIRKQTLAKILVG
jgi:hypothetical protein